MKKTKTPKLPSKEKARTAKRGLWQEKTPVPPWKWRRGQRQASSEQVLGKDFACGSKQYCKEMATCEEAKSYLKECGAGRLDGNNDGVPCEALCW